MPNPVPQNKAPNRNNSAAQLQAKNAPTQAQQLTAKSGTRKDATKRVEHFDVNPSTKKKNAPGRQMPAERRQQMDREIGLFVQAVFESFIRDAQSNGGNPAVRAAKPHNCSKAGKALASKSKNLEIDINALQKSDSKRGTVMGTWSKARNGPQCGHPQVPHDIAVHFTRLCKLSEETSNAIPPTKGKVANHGTALAVATGKDSKKGSALLPAQGTGQNPNTTVTNRDAAAKATDPKQPSTSSKGAGPRQQ